MNSNTHGEYGFPLVYEKTASACMQAKISLPAETIELIHRYFAAAANLYARIPLRKLYEIYNSQNAHISESDFLQVIQHSFRLTEQKRSLPLRKWKEVQKLLWKREQAVTNF